MYVCMCMQICMFLSIIYVYTNLVKRQPIHNMILLTNIAIPVSHRLRQLAAMTQRLSLSRLLCRYLTTFHVIFALILILKYILLLKTEIIWLKLKRSLTYIQSSQSQRESARTCIEQLTFLCAVRICIYTENTYIK